MMRRSKLYLRGARKCADLREVIYRGTEASVPEFWKYKNSGTDASVPVLEIRRFFDES